MTRRLPLFLLFLVTLFSCAGKQDSSLTQKIRGEGNRSLILTAGPEEVWVGVPFSLSLDMKGEKDDDVLFPKIDQEFLPEGLILKSFKADDNRLTLSVTAEKSGDFTIPPISVLFDNGGDSVELLTRPVDFSVVSLLDGEDQTMADISPSLRIGFMTLPWVLGLSGGALAAVLIAAWLIMRYRRKHNVPPEPVWVGLERDRDALSRDNSLMEGDMGRFYDLSTSLVRRALDGVYGESTGEKTREEFIGSLLTSSQYASEVKAWFVRFFERADLVRFARMAIEKDTIVRDLDETLRFTGQAVEEAKRKEEEEP
ncbi:MAG: hypothetical protein JXA95_09545 [Spirochaetales bacterium]|nr:hypothetical protein [Spirochaetales bacterium]